MARGPPEFRRQDWGCPRKKRRRGFAKAAGRFHPQCKTLRLKRRPIRGARNRVRSEERRVGKEGRSRCDWSSDVCSSDLNFLALESFARSENAKIRWREDRQNFAGRIGAAHGKNADGGLPKRQGGFIRNVKPFG